MTLLRGGAVAPSRRIRVLKIDTEGAEVPIVRGMTGLLRDRLIEHIVLEITPMHWPRFGIAARDAAAHAAFAAITDTYHYTAYLMYTQSVRQPPRRLIGSVFKRVDHHPLGVGPPDTDCPLGGGAFAPFWEIVDMKRFFTDYCLTFLEKVGHGGKCGNVWFASRESWYDVEKN